jgi:hypothetical protein
MDVYTKQALAQLVEELYNAMVEAGISEEQINLVNLYFAKRVEERMNP